MGKRIIWTTINLQLICLVFRGVFFLMNQKKRLVFLTPKGTVMSWVDLCFHFTLSPVWMMVHQGPHTRSELTWLRDWMSSVNVLRSDGLDWKSWGILELKVQKRCITCKNSCHRGLGGKRSVIKKGCVSSTRVVLPWSNLPWVLAGGFLKIGSKKHVSNKFPLGWVPNCWNSSRLPIKQQILSPKSPKSTSTGQAPCFCWAALSLHPAAAVGDGSGSDPTPWCFTIWRWFDCHGVLKGSSEVRVGGGEGWEMAGESHNQVGLVFNGWFESFVLFGIGSVSDCLPFLRAIMLGEREWHKHWRCFGVISRKCWCEKTHTWIRMKG